MLKQLKLLQTASVLALALALPVQAQETTTETAPATGATAAGTAATGEAATTGEAAAPAEGTDTTAPAAGDAAAPAEGEAAAAPTVPNADLTAATVVASVNGTDITLADVLVAVGQLPAQYQQLPPDVLFPGVVDQLIQQELLAQSVTEEPATLQVQLDNTRRSILANAALGAAVQAAVTPEAVQAAFDAQYANAAPTTEWDASHILVATEDEAKAVESRLAAGESFEDIAKEVSTDTGSGAQGGELGWFGPGMMVPEFEQGVQGLTKGQVSAPVQSQFGWHVIRLNDTREKPAPTLDEVRGEIEGQLQQQAVQDRLAALEAGAQVTRPAAGQFDPAAALNPALLGD